MTAIRVLQAAERVPERWRNGGGVTETIWSSPAAGGEGVYWRASVATIDVAGPFSLFPGMDRWFAAVEGRVMLSIDSRRRSAEAGGAIVAFSGEAAVTAEPVDGPVLAFNLMVTRGVATAAVGRRHGVWDLIAGTTLIFALERMEVVVGSTPFTLGPRDVLMREGAAGDHLTLRAPAIISEISLMIDNPSGVAAVHEGGITT